MNIWHMQIHPNDNSWPMEKIKDLVEIKSVIGMGNTWDNDRNAPQRFKDDVKIGDVIIIRHQGSPRYLVEVTSECKENSGNDLIDVWFEIYRNIRILSNEGPLYKDIYYKEYNKSWSSGIYAPLTFENANNWSFANYWYNQIKTINEMNQYTQLLYSNYNLILSGAPGTGKTYLAKRIAAQLILGKEYDERTASDDEQLKMKEQCGFVQFHPSYDYTDFVEGLRPKQDEAGNVGFERTDGVFKLFCKKAIKSRMVDGMDNFEEGWKRLVDYLNENQYIEIPLLTGARNICVELNEYGTGLAERLYADGKSVGDGEWVRGHSKFFTREQLYNIYRGNSGTPSGGHDNYRRAIVKYMIDNKWMKEYKPGHEKSESSKYVFIIDEINRGEISKIFGELFFSIDPGYRGTDGRVKTQYQNLVEEDDVFYDGFYVPDNVYIIGTMNDIDRSVESMDFAFRRRFAFKEVTAKESQQMLDSDSAWGKDENGESRKPSPEIISEIKQRMDALNDAICPDRKDSNQKGVEGLSSAYHIGASYFLKLVNYMNDGSVDYQKLWDNHLKGLLFEYLRGMPNAEGKLETLENAFFSKQS